MSTRRIYRRAPIVDAIIDLRVAPAAGIDITRLQQIADAEKPNYPKVENLQESSAEIAFGSTQSVSARSREIGLVLSSEDGVQSAHMDISGFAFHRKTPHSRWEEFRYSRWEEFSVEAKRLWGLYAAAMRPQSVTRLAVRFINRLIIPGATQDLTDYVRVLPVFSTDMNPSALSRFFMQLEIPQPDIEGAVAVVNQALLPATPDATERAIVLDVDLFRTANFEPQGSDIWDAFEVLHERKNRIFEASITDRMREKFE